MWSATLLPNIPGPWWRHCPVSLVTLTFEAQHDLHLMVAHERRLATAQLGCGTTKNGCGSL